MVIYLRICSETEIENTMEQATNVIAKAKLLGRSSAHAL